jgi:glycosyltransferase involved in cell wall biosynthesis
LKNQTDQDFLWLVIDDGSTDDTESIVRGWINEKKIEIVYHKINKGGQHKALQLGFNSAQTEYLVKIDSDDAFVPDAIDTYKRCWSLIESDNKKNIGNICALSRFENNEIDGNWKFPHDTYYIDSNWHEMVLRKGNNNELSYCTRTSILREIYPLSYTFWNEDKLHVISPAIFTSRIGRQCNTRFINKIVQVVYLDAPFSILRPKEKQTNRFLKVLVDTKYFLDENIDYFFWNPKYYINRD